jgi:DNA-binding protein H-NS
MSPDIDSLSLEQLEAQKAQFEQRIAALRQQERDAALQTVRELMAKHKFTARELAQAAAAPAAAKPAKNKNAAEPAEDSTALASA